MTAPMPRVRDVEGQLSSRPPDECCRCGCGRRDGLIFTTIRLDGYGQPGKWCPESIVRATNRGQSQ